MACKSPASSSLQKINKQSGKKTGFGVKQTQNVTAILSEPLLFYEIDIINLLLRVVVKPKNAYTF